METKENQLCPKCETPAACAHHGQCLGNTKAATPEMVDHPAHYNAHPSGVECIDVVEHMGFSLGNAIKYIWRADEKGAAVEDLEKAAWYIEREINRRKALTKEPKGV